MHGYDRATLPISKMQGFVNRDEEKLTQTDEMEVVEFDFSARAACATLGALNVGANC